MITNTHDITAIIMQGRLDKALTLALNNASGEDTQTIQNLIARYAKLEKDVNNHFLSRDESSAERGRITDLFLTLLSNNTSSQSGSSASILPHQNIILPNPVLGSNPAPATGGGSTAAISTPASTKGSEIVLFILGIISLGFLIYQSVINPTWANGNELLFKTILAIGASCALVWLPGKLEIGWKNSIRVAGGLGIFYLVFNVGPRPGPERITFILNNEKGELVKLLNDSAKVMVYFPSDSKTTFVTEGKAEFTGVSPSDLEKPLKVNLLNATPYKLLKPEQFHSFDKGKSTILTVFAEGLGNIEGKVFDMNGNPLTGIELSIENINVSSFSNGYFKFDIPKERQKSKYYLRVNKLGFEPYSKEVEANGSEIIVILKKKGKK